jgi:hypothetical protein
MARGGHGLPKVSLRPVMPYPSKRWPEINGPLLKTEENCDNRTKNMARFNTESTFRHEFH